MEKESIEVLQFIFGVVAGLFGIAAAFFRIWEIQCNEEFSSIQLWFKKKWKTIKNSYWLKLPEIVINSLIEFKNSLNKFVLTISSYTISKIGYDKRKHLIVFLIFGVARIVALFSLINVYSFSSDPYSNDNEIALFLVFSLYILGMIPTVISKITKKEIYWVRRFGPVTYRSIIAIYTTFLMYFPYTCVALLFKIETAVVHISLISLLMFFTYIFALQTHFNFARFSTLHYTARTDILGEHIMLFMFAFSISLIVTSISLLIGKFASPNITTPQSLQLFLSNAIFDSVTLLTTFVLLQWAVQGKLFIKVPLAIILDIIFSAFYACFSLYFGLLGGEKSLTLTEIFNILLAKSVDGERIELSAYFWVMHTTFLPTLIYCFIILISWICKLILIPIQYFLGLGQENKNPMKLTAAVCVFLGAVFSFLSYLTGTLK